MAPPPDPFATVLRRHRVEAEMTQEQLAESAHLSTRAVGDLERGFIARPRLHTVRQLAEALRLSGEPAAAFEQAARATRGLSSATLKLPTGDFLGAVPESELVARGHEMERVATVVDLLPEGAGHVLVFAGERGIGKTRLLQEVMIEALARGCTVLTAGCRQSQMGIPYSPVVDAFSELASRSPSTVRSDVERRWKRIQQAASDGKPVGEGASEALVEQKLFADVRDLVLLAAKPGPLALLLDDLHWADAGSLRLIHYLATSLRTSSVLIAGSFDDAVVPDKNPELADLLQTLSREKLVERVVVRRLSLEETSELVAVTMGQRSTSEEFASFVYRRTKGVPRLVVQLVRSLGGRLELQGEIGAGSTGRVFRAFDRQTDRVVAAKLILAREGIDLSDLLRFQSEGAVLSRLDHPNIVRVYDTFAEEHAACIIMELLDGPSLAQILQDGPIPLSRAREIGAQTAAALAHAHSQSIVHRDIKPDNVVVLAEDYVKVTDFGIARILRTDNSLATMATTGMRAGTPSYMAPEQISDKPIDGRADVYALGAMLFHMVAGRPPFEGPDKLSIAVKHLQDQPVAPSSINPEVPSDWDALILKALQKEPSRRFQSAREMEAEIEALSEKPGAAGRKPARGFQVFTAAGALAAVLAIAAFVVLHAASPSHASGLGGRLNTYLTGLASQRRLSGTVLVARHGRIVLDKGYGLANRLTHTPAVATTTYAIPGVTAVISITDLVMNMKNLGSQFGWSHHICQYLAHPCPSAWRPITLRMLLEGTAGLPHTDNLGQAGATPDHSLVAYCQSLLARPGTRTDYENCGDLAMGILVQRVGFAANAWEAQVAPISSRAGMRRTGRLTDAASISPSMARDYSGASAYPSPEVYTDDVVAYSTAADVYRFDNAFFEGTLLYRAQTRLLLTPRAPFIVGTACCAFPDPGIAHPRWAYEWKTGFLFGRRVYYTYEAENGFQALNMRFPASGLTAVLLSNDLSNDGLGIGMNAAGLAFGRPIPRPARIPAYTPAPLLGTWHRTFNKGDLKIAHDSGTMVGVPIILTFNRGWIGLGLPGQPYANDSEYISASATGGLTLLDYLRTSRSACGVSIMQPMLPARYHWKRTGNFLTITQAAPDWCPDRAAFWVGRWRKVT